MTYNLKGFTFFNAWEEKFDKLTSFQFDIDSEYGNKAYSGWNLTSVLRINHVSHEEEKTGHFASVINTFKYPNGKNLTNSFQNQMKITTDMTYEKFKNMEYPNVILNYGIPLLPITEVSIQG